MLDSHQDERLPAMWKTLLSFTMVSVIIKMQLDVLTVMRTLLLIKLQLKLWLHCLRQPVPVRRVKTYLRSTMTQLRFNNLLVLHLHKKGQILYNWLLVWMNLCLEVNTDLHCLEHSEYCFMYISVSNLHFPQMKLASEKPPDAIIKGVISKIFLGEHPPPDLPRVWHPLHAIPHLLIARLFLLPMALFSTGQGM